MTTPEQMTSTILTKESVILTSMEPELAKPIKTINQSAVQSLKTLRVFRINLQHKTAATVSFNKTFDAESIDVVVI